VEPGSPGILGGVGRNKVMCDPATVGTASARAFVSGDLARQSNTRKLSTGMITSLAKPPDQSFVAHRKKSKRERINTTGKLPFFRRLLLRPLLSESSGG